MRCRISVDIGGTFTDLVLAEATGTIHVGKAPTKHARVFEGIWDALRMVAEKLDMPAANLLRDCEAFVYASTRATNAILEGKTARTALLTTEGFPDTLVLREGGKQAAFDFRTPYPEPYVPRRLTFEIRERITSEGEVAVPLDEQRSRTTLRGLAARRIEAIAVCLLWSPVNAEHEIALGRLIDEELPGVPYTLSHQLNPILREYRRASSTAIDASLKPLMEDHLRGLEADLVDAGFAGRLLAAVSSGGVTPFDELMRRPIYSVRSGPALAPVAGQAEVAADGADGDLIVCDTGGTSFDVSVVRDGRIKLTRETWLGERFTGHLTGLSSVDARSIGAGGGSIAWIDAGGLLRVGPQSAGSEPGPACYGRGGTLPTVTDAAAVVGYLDPDFFLGGRMRLDLDTARAALGELAIALDRSIEETAIAILAVANEHMVGAIQDITVNEGIDPRESLVVAGGGAAGMNIVKIARELGCRRVFVPRAAGALSAVGAHHSDLVSEVSVSEYARSDIPDLETLNARLAELDASLDALQRDLGGRGVSRFDRAFSVEARYLNQIWELQIPVADRRLDEAAVERLVEGFHEEHERVFAVRDGGAAVEFMLWRGRLIGERGRSVLTMGRDPGANGHGTRPVFFADAGLLPATIVHGPSAPLGSVIEGPAVIEEPTTTVVVYPDSRATVTDEGNYMIEVD
ncbi:MAG TPA: hydantoinase/oxoprolinase family protein [Baekduia sp.]|uniref:hydantoinase/oxoprolinase family protein n=1 Tax=Baekduia sp. TaxID=2600305 RepID=UPI002D793D48|nr:hydantoinase/oxoprolinase family protein [Baekduia sp.]HET6509087.1 hydantoinase/oxoprolinase family protein [Baekduia sp.]